MKTSPENCQHLIWPSSSIGADDSCVKCGATLSALRLAAAPMPVSRGDLERELQETRERVRQLANAAVGPQSFEDAEQCVSFVVYFASQLEMPERARFVQMLGEGLRPLMTVPPTAVAAAAYDAVDIVDERCTSCGAALSDPRYVHNPCGLAPTLHTSGGVDVEKVEG